MHDVVITGGTVLTSSGTVEVDVAITDGVVAALGADIGPARTTIDASGAWVGPGLVDLHTHLREPGHEWKEDIASGSAAAAAGGYTAVVAMPNTDPAVDRGHLARYVADRGREVGLVDVVPAGALTLGRAGATMAHIDELWDAGVRIFSDDGDSVADAAVLRLVMEYIAELGGVVSQHAVDPALSRAGHMHEGAVSSRLGMYGIPAEADDIVVARDLALARLTGVRYHVQHVSTAGALGLIAQAKDTGVSVTCEVTPHHLLFSDEDVATADPDLKMMPPLRAPRDRAALVDGLRSGLVDVVATDHAPHAAIEKEVPFEEAPNGVLGLEWAASATIMAATPDIDVFFDRMATAPARIAGLDDHGRAIEVGMAANLAVIDPTTTWTPSSSRSKSRNAPYLGRELTGTVRATLLRGSVTHGGAS